MYCWWICKKKFQQFTKEENMKLSYDIEIPCLCLYPKELRCRLKHLYSNVFLTSMTFCLLLLLLLLIFYQTWRGTHYGSHLQFLNDWWSWPYLHVLLIHLYIFFYFLIVSPAFNSLAIFSVLSFLLKNECLFIIW